MSKNQNLKEILQSIKNYLMINHPFWGTIVANLDVEIDDKSEDIAKTDCFRKIVFGTRATNLDKKSLLFVFLHEVLHAAFSHSQRGSQKSPLIWNVACDYAVNSILIEEMNYSPPAEIGCLYDKKYSKLSAEEIYYILIEELAKEICPVAKLNKGGSPFESNQEQRQGQGQGEGQDEEGKTGVSCPLKTENTPNACEKCLREKLPKVYNLGDLLPSKKPKEEMEKMKEVLIQAEIIHSKWKTRGNIPGSLAEYIKKIKETKIPFERLLAKYVSELVSGKEEFTYNPIHKRKFAMFEIVAPSISKRESSKVVVVVDTSGSISTKELEIFAGAIKKLSSTVSELTLITHDVEIQQIVRSYEIENFLKELKFKGRGGTSHIKAFEYIEQELCRKEGLIPDVVICLTDGYSEYPERPPRFPVIWVLTKEHKEPPWGLKTVIEEND